MFTCDVGDVPQISVVWTDSMGTPVDPTTITLYLKQPSGSVGTFQYPAQVTRLAQGTYAYNGTATATGYWYVRWVGDGAAVAAQQSEYFVNPINT